MSRARARVQAMDSFGFFLGQLPALQRLRLQCCGADAQVGRVVGAALEGRAPLQDISIQGSQLDSHGMSRQHTELSRARAEPRIQLGRAAARVLRDAEEDVAGFVEVGEEGKTADDCRAS